MEWQFFRSGVVAFSYQLLSRKENRQKDKNTRSESRAFLRISEISPAFFVRLIFSHFKRLIKDIESCA